MVKRINLLGIVILATLFLFPFSFAQETLTLTTYYPSPYGSYNQLYVSDKLGIGTTSAGFSLDVQKNGGNPEIVGTAFGTGFFTIYRARSARGTQSLPSATGISDTIGFFGMHGYGATAFSGSANASIAGYAAENFSDTAMGTYLTFGTTPTGSAARQERVRIDAAGNVGIGVTGPTLKLEVSGDIKSTATVRSGDGSAAAPAHTFTTNTGTGLYYAAGPTLGFSTSGTSRMVIDSAGNVGIGGTPGIKLQVFGDMRVGTSGTNGCVQRYDGTPIVGSCSSDICLKRDIKPLSGVLDKVAQLRPVSYYWRSKEYPKLYLGNQKNLGLIAQDVEKVMPELVSTDDQGLKRVNYGVDLFMLMIQSIKELKAENDGLKARVERLEQALKNL